MNVFISSVVRGFEPFRDAAADAARVLGHGVLRSEDLPAGPDPAERACLDLVRRADVVVLLLGARYGAATERELSPTHQEYREARAAGKDTLAFVQAGVEPEPRQRAFIEEVRQWATGTVIRSFSTPDGLRDGVIRALSELALSRAAGRADPDEMAARAEAPLRELTRRVHDATLVLAVAPGPAQQLVRPQQMTDDAFQRELEKEALYGEAAILLRGAAVRTELERGVLTVHQDNAHLAFDADGTTVIAVPATRRDSRSPLPALIREDIRDQLASGLRFIARTLDRVDPGGRTIDVAPLAALVNIGYSGWRTRAEQERDPNRLAMNVQALEIAVVRLHPASRRRRALTAEPMEIAEDLTELLRQEVVR